MEYILFDKNGKDGIKSFISQRTSLQMKEIYSPKKRILLLSWLLGVYNVLKISERGDTIICWYDFQAVLCYWMCMLLRKKRKIVCINILLKDKRTIKNKAVAYLYKRMLNSSNIIASVTSKEYGEHIKKRLNIKKDFFLLHDVYHDSYKYDKEVQVIPDTVFCGGKNGRDWGFIIDVARATPSVEFHLVMPSSEYDQYKDNMPQNVIAKYNMSMEDFTREMCSCSLVALPLDTEAPAGLIVMFQAAANCKLIMTTDTMTTREYLSGGRGILLPNEVDTWSENIKERLVKQEENKVASANMLEFLRRECSEEIFCEGIEKMIKMII